jgi:hypothetical protein
MKRVLRFPERKKNPAAVALGKLGGFKGGHARAANLTPENQNSPLPLAPGLARNHTRAAETPACAKSLDVNPPQRQTRSGSAARGWNHSFGLKNIHVP